MHIGVILLVFAVIFIAELPDKSLFAALILGTKFPARYVWLGAASAFFVHVIIAVTAGHFLTLLPHRVLEAVIAALFLAGAGLILFGKHGLEDTPEAAKPVDIHNPWKVYATAFSVVFIGEWGDITQIATANYAAKYHDTVNVAIGAILALWLVTLLAVTAGAKVLSRVPAHLLQRVTGGVLLLFGILSIIAAIK